MRVVTSDGVCTLSLEDALYAPRLHSSQWCHREAQALGRRAKARVTIAGFREGRPGESAASR